VLALYEHLQQANMPQLMTQFEKVIGTFMGEIGEQREHNEALQNKFNQSVYLFCRVLLTHPVLLGSECIISRR